MADPSGILVTAGHVMYLAEVEKKNRPGSHVVVLFRAYGGPGTAPEPEWLLPREGLEQPRVYAAPASDYMMYDMGDANGEYVELDLCAFRADAPPQLDGYEYGAVAFADDDGEPGDDVVACGYPFPEDVVREHADPLYLPSFTPGVVSAVLPSPAAPSHRRTALRLHMFADIGNSGGPVADPRTGQVVAVLRDGIGDPPDVRSAAHGRTGNTGIARAIPARFARELVGYYQRSRSGAAV